jgi:hypothetical protein
MKYNRFLPLIIPALVFIFYEFYSFRPKLLFVVLVLMWLIFFFTVRQFLIEGKSREKWWSFIIIPGVFTTGLLIFSTMVPSRLIVQLLFVFNTIIVYIYFRSIYYYLVQPKRYKNDTLENLSSYGNFLSIYFISASSYGLQVFLGIEVWLTMILIIVTFALVIYQVLWINRIDMRRGFLFILVMCLALIQVAWAASFLTLSFYVLGLILAVCYYILIGLVRFYLLGRLTPSLIKIYLAFGFGSIIIVLLTANWISIG